MAYVDYQELKSRVTIEQVVEMLGIEMKKSAHQLRGACPACNSDNARALAITPAKGLFFCFNGQVGGDIIALVAHINGVAQKDAAKQIAEHFQTVPRENGPRERGANETKKLEPLDYLQADHPAVEAVGFDKETADALGIGWASKGTMSGTVAIPVRLPDGTLAGYVGVTEAKLPKSWQLTPSNVVKFPKSA